MKTLKSLTASDFPGVDPKKFSEWKQTTMRTRGSIYVVLAIYLVMNIKSYGVTGHIIYDTPVVMLIGFLLTSQYTRYAISRHTLYVMISLCFLIVFNIILVLNTGLYVGESLIAIVVLFWLFYQSEKNNKSAIELGIDSVTLKRVLSK